MRYVGNWNKSILWCTVRKTLIIRCEDTIKTDLYVCQGRSYNMYCVYCNSHKLCAGFLWFSEETTLTGGNFHCRRNVLCAIRFEFLNTVKLAVNGSWLEGNPVLSGKNVQFRGSYNSPYGICMKQSVPATEKSHIPCRSVIGRFYPIIYSSVEQPFFSPIRAIWKSPDPERAANQIWTVKALISQGKFILYLAIGRLISLLIICKKYVMQLIII